MLFHLWSIMWLKQLKAYIHIYTHVHTHNNAISNAMVFARINIAHAIFFACRVNYVWLMNLQNLYVWQHHVWRSWVHQYKYIPHAISICGEAFLNIRIHYVPYSYVWQYLVMRVSHHLSHMSILCWGDIYTYIVELIHTMHMFYICTKLQTPRRIKL